MKEHELVFAKYCVIGSGAATFGFLSGLKDTRGDAAGLDDVVVISSDVGNRLQKKLEPNSTEEQTCSSVKKLTKGKKLYFDDDYVYREHPFWRISSHRFGHIPSFSFGGLTRVWGATADVWPKEFLEKLGGIRPFIKEDLETFSSRFFQTKIVVTDTRESSNQALVISESLKRLMKVPQKNHQRWRFRASNLAIQTDTTKTNACTACGNCLNGCPSDAIWSADRALNPYLASLGQVLIGLVDDVKILLDGVEVGYTSNDGNRKVVRAKYCILAAGVPSTVKLFCKAAELITTRGDDTPITFRLGFSIKRGKTSTHNLSHIVGEAFGFAVQLYPPNIQVWNRLIPPRLLANPIIKRFLEHVVPIITYGRPVKNCIKFDGDSFTAGKPKRSFKMHLSLAKDLLRGGIFLIPFVSQRGEFGESYHSGAYFKELVNADGFVSEKSKVYIADAAGLPFIRPGSITPTIILNSIRLGRCLETDLLLSDHEGS